MNQLLVGIPVVLAALAAGGAHAACSKDGLPAIPDGKAATQEDMVAAQTAVKAYIASANDYLACVQKVLDAESTPKEEKGALATQYNAAVDEMQQVATNWKTAITAFKSK